MIQPCRRFLALDRTRAPGHRSGRADVRRWAGVRLFRLVTLRRALDRLVVLTSGNCPSAGEDVVLRVRRAVNAVAARIPAARPAWCNALAVDGLRGGQVTCGLRFGVRFSEAAGDPLEGHAWVECCGSTIDASDGRSAFSVLSR